MRSLSILMPFQITIPLSIIMHSLIQQITELCDCQLIFCWGNRQYTQICTLVYIHIYIYYIHYYIYIYIHNLIIYRYTETESTDWMWRVRKCKKSKQGVDFWCEQLGPFSKTSNSMGGAAIGKKSRVCFGARFRYQLNILVIMLNRNLESRIWCPSAKSWLQTQIWESSVLGSHLKPWDRMKWPKYAGRKGRYTGEHPGALQHWEVKQRSEEGLRERRGREVGKGNTMS